MRASCILALGALATYTTAVELRQLEELEQWSRVLEESKAI